MRQHDSPPDEDDYGGDDGGEEHEPAEYSQSYNASCGVICSCRLSRQSDNTDEERTRTNQSTLYQNREVGFISYPG